MSLDLFITGNAETFPSARDWAAAIKLEGFNVELHQTFDTRQSSGFLPCPNAECGFEYSFGPLSEDDLEGFEIEPNLKSEILKHDSIAGLHYTTDCDFEIVKVASAVLANMIGGFVLEAESGAIMTSSQALAWARYEFEPQVTIRASTAARKQQLSPITMAKLALVIAIVGYWLWRWLIR